MRAFKGACEVLRQCKDSLPIVAKIARADVISGMISDRMINFGQVHSKLTRGARKLVRHAAAKRRFGEKSS